MLKKSVVIANRHSTSISLEPEFMEELEAIARQKGLSVNQLVTEIDSKREHENLSSAIRIYILNHLKKTNPGNEARDLFLPILLRKIIFYLLQ